MFIYTPLVHILLMLERHCCWTGHTFFLLNIERCQSSSFHMLCYKIVKSLNEEGNDVLTYNNDVITYNLKQSWSHPLGTSSCLSRKTGSRMADMWESFIREKQGKKWRRSSRRKSLTEVITSHQPDFWTVFPGEKYLNAWFSGDALLHTSPKIAEVNNAQNVSTRPPR